MQELENKLHELRMDLHKEATERAESSDEVWKAIGKLADLVTGLIKEVGELRIDVDKLIENNQGVKKSA